MNDYTIYSAMQTGSPYKTYRKTVLGIIYVTAIDPFSEQPTPVKLYGDPRKGEESCFIDVWSDKDDMFFKKMNAIHFKNGYIIEDKREEKKVVDTPIEQYSDEKLREVINMKFLGLQARLNKTKSEAVISRMLALARSMGKSDAIVRAIEARLAEVQGEPVVPEEDTTTP